MKPAPAPVAMEAFLNAALEGDLATVKQALSQPGAATFAGPDDRTALMLAAFNGHTKIAKLLLESGANIDARDQFPFPRPPVFAKATTGRPVWPNGCFRSLPPKANSLAPAIPAWGTSWKIDVLNHGEHT